MRNCVSVLILVSVHVALVTHAIAQAASYQALVQSYREDGRADAKALLAMPRDAVTQAVDSAVSGTSSWSWEDLRAAAMLHSETCVAEANDQSTCEFHVMQAERLLYRTVRLSPRQEDFAWRWYQAMAHVVNLLGQKSLARGIQTQASEKWHSDLARAEYVRGLELESKGSHQPIAQGVSGPNAYDKAGARASYFAEAAALFTSALHRRPDLTVAALHLGRIRMLQEKRGEAAALFRSALIDVDPVVRYLSALFLGTLEEREGRLAAAEKLYRNALEYMPFGQSAPLALSELLSRTGRAAEARSVLAARVLRMNGEVLEPFWVYGPIDEVPAARFDLLRIEVWK